MSDQPPEWVRDWSYVQLEDGRWTIPCTTKNSARYVIAQIQSKYKVNLRARHVGNGDYDVEEII